MVKTKYKTPYGTGILLWRDDMLAGHVLPESGLSLDNDEGASNGETRMLAARLESYFRGERVSFSQGDLPIDWTAWTPFEKKVARALIEVPYGQTLSYADLAAAAGFPRAHRAVGNFMAKNPYPILIPCHRVVRSDGTMGKFSAGGHWKLRLLELEGVRL